MSGVLIKLASRKTTERRSGPFVGTPGLPFRSPPRLLPPSPPGLWQPPATPVCFRKWSFSPPALPAFGVSVFHFSHSDRPAVRLVVICISWMAKAVDISHGLIFICVPSFMSVAIPGGPDSKESACSAGDSGLIPGSGRSPGEGNGNPLQYSCLENSMDRGAWQTAVHGVAEK